MKLTNATLTECGPHRLQSRSIAYNANGSHLAMGTSSSAIHVWDTTKEVSVLSGHAKAVTVVRYHPTNLSSLLSAAGDSTVRLWDVRSSSSSRSSVGKIDTRTHPYAVEWNPVQSHVFLVMERSGDVTIHDSRKLSSTSAASTALYTKSMHPDLPESCCFDPTGDFLVAGTTRISKDGVAELKIWEWKSKDEAKVYSFPAHTGVIFSMSFSKDGRKLVTCGNDAIAALWDVKTMLCVHAVSKHKKYVLSAAFSPDDKMFATSTEDEAILLSDSDSGEIIGEIGSTGSRPRPAGAEVVAFHPTSHYMLACANAGTTAISPVTLAKLTVS